jgi:ADP-heptose:LPS heptosyltransferase
MGQRIVLYSHDGKLGDAVVMTGLVEALHRAGHEIHVTASRGNLDFWRADTRLAGVIDVPKTGVWAKLAALRQLRRIEADLLFSWDLHPSSTGTLLARFSGASKKVGFCATAGSVFDKVLEFDPARDHITRKYAQAAALLGVPLRPPRIGFEVEPSPLPDQAGCRGKVFLNFVGSVPDKSLTGDAARTVLDRFSAEFPDWLFVVCYMARHAWVASLAAGRGNVLAVRTDQDWLDLYRVMSACDAVVTVDTSIAHIATALGKPLLDIFCKDAQALVNFRPVGERVAIVESASAEVISEVDPDELVSALRGLLPAS